MDRAFSQNKRNRYLCKAVNGKLFYVTQNQGKITLIILIALLLAVLVSCKNSGEGEGTDTLDTAAEIQVDTTAPATEPTVDTGYLDIETVKSRLSVNRYLGKKDDNTLLKLRIPKQWSLVSTGESNYDIVRESATVGEIRYSENKEDHAGCLYHEDFSVDGISVNYCIFKDSGQSSGYRRVYSYKYTSGGK